MNWVIKHRNQRTRKAFFVITYFGSVYVWLFLYIFLFLFGGDNFRSVLLLIIFAELLGLLIIILFRSLIKRARPNSNIFFLLPWQIYSFPSHHALRVSMLSTIFGASYSWLLPFLIFITFIVSISRIYLVKHYPFDVFAGLIFGFLCANFTLFIF